MTSRYLVPLRSINKLLLDEAGKGGFGRSHHQRRHHSSSSSAMTTLTLACPEKAETDLKEYRVIQLHNGLKALLIADTKYDLKKLDQEEQLVDMDDEDDDEEEDDSGDDEEEDEEDEEDYEDDPRTTKKTASTSSGLKKSAAALCVHVGSFSDPDSIPGLAHFLEHMVFMGSEKYPDENSFDTFIQKHGGYDNASTDCTTTNFYFETQRKSFKEGN